MTGKLKAIPAVTALYRNFGDIEKMQHESEVLWREAKINGRDHMDIRAMDIIEPEKMKLLNLIAIFGTYSMIVLACRERKREIAVRKVHGAKVRDIIRIFSREYGGTLLLSTFLAFGVGYIMMHRWIQQYERQITISWWIYAVILAAIVLVISITVGHQVLKTARQNPADVIKSE